MKLFILLFLQFFHIGIFSFGGGYATLPFLYDIAEKYNWYTSTDLTNMLAISSITPGPVGINVATFAGYSTAGIVGAFIATISIIMPSLIIVSIVYKILDKFETNLYVKGAISSLKPAGCALLSAVGVNLLFSSNLQLLGVLALLIFIGVSYFKKFDPLIYLGVSALYGLLLGHFGLIGV